MIPTLIYIFMTLQLADIVSTVIALKSTVLVEKNKILAFVMSKIGVLNTLVLFKAILIGMVGYVYIENLMQETALKSLLIALCAMYAFVVISNFRQIKK